MQPCVCGFENPSSNRFCGGCGMAVSKLVDDRQLMHVTILFADICGSTRRTDGLSPDDTEDLVGPAIAAMLDAVRSNEGFAESTGDGIRAVFGAPRAHEAHATRACQAALAMQREIRRRTDLAVRIGLHSAKVLIKPNQAGGYEPVGSGVNLAKRSEELTTPGTIWVSEATYRLAEGHIHTRSRGRHLPRDFTQPLEYFELLDIITHRTAWEARSTRRLSELTGRTQELEILQALVERAELGEGRSAALHGEPGVGKSRIAHEIARRCRARGWTVLETGAALHESHAGALALTRLLRAWLDVPVEASSDQCLERLARRIAADRERLEPHRDALHATLDLPVALAWEELDALLRRQALEEALGSVLRSVASASPLLLVVEDPQWMDEWTRSTLLALARSLATSRCLTLFTARPEIARALTLSPDDTMLKLQPLAPTESDRLLRALLGSDPALDTVRSRIRMRTEGNPLFIEEAVRALADHGSLKGERGAYTLAGTIDEIVVPETVRLAIESRVDRLDRDVVRTLQIAAVIGTDVPLVLLRATASTDAAPLTEALETLTRAEFLYDDAPEQDQVYRFKHALTHDVVYKRLPRDTRRNLHRLVFDAILSQIADRLDENAQRLADHVYRGQLWDKGPQHHLRAAIRAMARFAPREAALQVDRGLDVAAHIQDVRARAFETVQLHLRGVNALIPLGDLPGMLAHLEKAQPWAQLLGDPRWIGQTDGLHATALWLAGDHDRSLELAERAHAVGRELGLLTLSVMARYTIGINHHARGDFSLSIQVLKDLLRDLNERDQTRPGWASFQAIFVRVFIAGGLIDRGELDEAEGYVEHARKQADTIDHPYAQSMAHELAAQLALGRGRLPDLIPDLERARTLCVEREVHTMRPSIVSRLALAYGLAGRHDDAERVVREATDPEVYSKGGKYTWIFAHNAAARCALLAGAAEHAVEPAAFAVKVAYESGARALLGESQLVQGEVFLALGQHAQARARFASARAIAEQCEMRPLLARARQMLEADVDPK